MPGPDARQIEEAIEHAKRLTREGRLLEADHLFRSVLASRPNHFDANYLLGILKMQQGRPQEAIELLTVAARIKPNSPEVQASLGAALLALDRPAEALQHYERVIALKPAKASAHNNRGVALSRLGRHHEAIASYQRTLALSPTHVAALFNNADSLARVNRDQEALANYDRVLAVQPDHVEALNKRGDLLRKLGRDSEKSSDHKARSFDPNIIGGLHEPGAEAALDNRSASLVENGEQTRQVNLTNTSDRERLTPAAISAIVRLSSFWKLTGAETRALLGGMSERSFARLKSGGWSGTLTQDELTRISALIGIFKGLHVLFSQPLADEWPKLANKGPLFRGATPVTAMIEGGIPAIIATRRYIDALRGGA
jgi:tetratricopeptide (TPR) repeat protein